MNAPYTTWALEKWIRSMIGQTVSIENESIRNKTSEFSTDDIILETVEMIRVHLTVSFSTSR